MKRLINAFPFLLLMLAGACKKVVTIDPPVNSITTTQVFADSSDAASAVVGMYSSIAYRTAGIGNYLMTIYPGMSSDELLAFGSVSPLVTNTLVARIAITDQLWTQSYDLLYKPNAIIDGLQASATLPQTVKNELLGEAYWFRAFIDFYLTNLYGDIPLITTISYKSNALAPRVPAGAVNTSIVSDLRTAQSLLPADYSEGKGERVRVNQWAATALLARVHLYLDSFALAESEATAVLNRSDLYGLDTLNGVFLANNSEAILQWQNNSSANHNTYNATEEGSHLIPSDRTSQPLFYLTEELLNDFESGDQRKTAWLDSTVYEGVTYYYPFKYKVGPTQMHPGAPVTEYYTVLRLAEQYLIRAEARAQQNNLGGAISDLNMIRERAGLADLSPSLDQQQVLAAVAQERRIELFAEWGHRWFDLKRTNTTGTVFSSIPYKTEYQPYQQLYPIPLGELSTDPNLTQNPGY